MAHRPGYSRDTTPAGAVLPSKGKPMPEFQEASPSQIEHTLKSINWNRNERIRLERVVWEKEKEIAALNASYTTKFAEQEKRIAYSEKREASLDDDYQEARREVTVLATHIDQIMEVCQAALAMAAVARYGLSAAAKRKGGKGIDEEIADLIAQGLNIDPHNPPPPPPRVVHTERPNRLAKMVEDLQDEEMPKFLRQGPVIEAEPQETRPLAALAEMLSPKK